MHVNKQMLGAAVLTCLLNIPQVQSATSLVAPKGAKVLTVGVIGGTISILSRIPLAFMALTVSIQTMAGPAGFHRQITFVSRSFLSS